MKTFRILGILIIVGLIPTIAIAATEIKNEATATYTDASGSTFYPVSASATVNKLDPASLSVSVSVRNVKRGETDYKGSTNAISGDEVEFKITLTNNGEDAATRISVTNPIPTGLTYSTGTASATAGSVTYNTEEKKLIWSVDQITGGDYKELTFKATVD
jgi:uncharacterized repeat protein (TIGR01451 family)